MVMLKTGNGRGRRRRYTELRKDDLVRERKRASCSVAAETKRRVEVDEISLLIFVQHDSVDHHVVALTEVVHMYWNTNSHPSTHSILIKLFAAFGYVNDLFPKTVVPRPDCFFEHDAAARRVLGNCAVALRGGGRGSGFRHLCPRERRGQP